MKLTTTAPAAQGTGEQLTVKELDEFRSDVTLRWAVDDCPLCHKAHPSLAFVPVTLPWKWAGDEVYTHAANCPETGNPMWMTNERGELPEGPMGQGGQALAAQPASPEAAAAMQAPGSGGPPPEGEPH